MAFSKSVVWFALKVALFKLCLNISMLHIITHPAEHQNNKSVLVILLLSVWFQGVIHHLQYEDLTLGWGGLWSGDTPRELETSRLCPSPGCTRTNCHHQLASESDKSTIMKLQSFFYRDLTLAIAVGTARTHARIQTKIVTFLAWDVVQRYWAFMGWTTA